MTEQRIVVVGAGGVGKSSLTIQFIKGAFTSAYDPTIEDSYRKQVVVDGEHLVLDILDTAGQEDFSAMRSSYVRTGQGFLCVYSITSEASVKELRSYHGTILRAKNADKVPMIIIGNKCDLSEMREVPVELCASLGEEFGCPSFESSAKDNINVTEGFEQLSREVSRLKPEIDPKALKRLKRSGGSSGLCLLL
jgi:GTPase KRas